MRIESPVGCPKPPGDPVEEKTVPDGPTGLFTSILDCFRVLISAPPSDDKPAYEAAESTGKAAELTGTAAPNDAISAPAAHRASAGCLNGATAHVSETRPDTRDVAEAGGSPTRAVPSGIPFTLAVTGLVADGEQVPGAPYTGAHQVLGSYSEALAAAKTGTQPDLSNLPDMPGGGTDPRNAATLEASPSSAGEPGYGSQAMTAAGGPPDAAGDSALVNGDGEAAVPTSSTSAENPPVPPLLAQTATAALVFGPDFLQTGLSSSSDRKASVMPSTTAQSTKGTFSNSGSEPATGFATASATAWMPQRAVASMKANASQPGGRSSKTATASQAAAGPEERAAYAKLSSSAGGVDPLVDAAVKAQDAVSYSAAQKLTDKTPASTPTEAIDGRPSGERADSRPAAVDSGAEPRSQSQPGSATRPTGPEKITPPVDSAAVAVELEKVTAGRGRMRATFEGGAREASGGSSISTLARDPQVSAQASAVVKDVKAPAFIFEVAERVSTVVAGGRGEITIQLRPDEFGRMNIIAESGAGGILARITTESASLKQYLESNLPALQHALQEQGLKVERIDVLVQEGLSQQQSANQWQHNFGHAPGGQDSDRTPRFPQMSSVQPGEPANEITLDAVILGALHPNSTFYTIA